MLLAEIDDIQVVGEARNGMEAIRLSRELEPDIILMDLLMPIMDGVEATRQITAQQPQMRVLAMTSIIYHEKIIPAIQAGARGYAMKELEPSELIRSIYKVHRGEPAFPPGIALKTGEVIVEQPVNSDMTVHKHGDGEWQVQSMREMNT